MTIHNRKLSLRKGFARIGVILVLIALPPFALWAWHSATDYYDNESRWNSGLGANSSFDEKYCATPAVAENTASDLGISLDSLLNVSPRDQQSLIAALARNDVIHLSKSDSSISPIIRIRGALAAARYAKERQRKRFQSILLYSVAMVALVIAFLAAVGVTLFLLVRWVVRGFWSTPQS